MTTELPNWVNLAYIKSVMYLNLKDVDAVRDEALVLLGQMVTGSMICYMDNPDIDTDNPPISLVRAALEQTCYEWKQRATPGLQSVQMQDGSINKYQIDEWLKDVEKKLRRHMRYALHETSTTETTYTDPEPSFPTVHIAAPVLSSVTSEVEKATAVWTTVTGTVQYNLYYRAGTTVTKDNGIKIPNVTSPKIVLPLLGATTYAFAVTAEDLESESILSNVRTATPTAV